MKTKFPLLRIDRLLLAALALLATPQVQAQLYYQTNGTNATWTTAVWNTTGSGTFSSSWVSGTNAIFGTANGGTNLVTFATTTVGDITVNGNTTISSAGTLTWKAGGSTVTVANGVTLNWGQTVTTTASGNIVTKAGAGLWILGAYGSAHSATGGSFTLNAGTIRIGGANNFGGANGSLLINGGVIEVLANRTNANSVTINSGFELTGTSVYAASGAVSLGAGTHTITNSTTSGTRTFSGVISSAAAGGLNFGGSGTGTIILSNANTYTGKTTIQSGTVVLTNTGCAGATSSDLDVIGGVLNLGAGTKTNAAFLISGGSITNGTLQATSYALQGGSVDANLGTGTATATTGTTTLNGTLGATTVNVNSGALNLGATDRLANGAVVTIAGGTLGMGTNNDTVSTFTITNGILNGTTGILTASSYALQGGTINARLGAGAITVATGTTILGSAGRLDASSTLALNSGQFDLGGNETVAAISGAGGTLNLGASTLTFGGNNANTTYSGAIAGTGGGIIKAGSGRTILAGNSSYTGATTINTGTLAYNGTNTSTAVAVNTGSTLIGTGSVGATTINSGGTMNPGMSPGTQTYSSLIWESGGNYNWELHDASAAAGTGYDTFVSTGAFTINATSGSKFNINLWTLSSISPGDVNGEAVNFTGTSSYSWTLGSFGSISGFDANKFTINTVATNGTGGFANPFSGTFAISTNSTELLLVYTAPVLGSDYTWNAGSGLWGTAGNWTNNATPTNGASIIFAGAGGGASTNQGTVNSISGLLFSNMAGSYTLFGDALTVGVGGIDNESTAAQTIDNNLTLGAAQSFLAASGNLTIGGTVDNGGFLLSIAGASNTAINGTISGAGGLTKNGTGSLTLAGANSYAGGTTINAGTVVGTTASLQGDIGNGSFLEFSQAGDGAYGGAISGAGLVTKSGAGNVTFSGGNTYNGGTIVSGGTLTGSTASVPGDVDISSSATFALDQTTNGIFSGLIEGTGRLLKAGSGNVTFEGANTYSGGTLVSGGTLTGTATSLQGSITNNAAVVFNQTSAGTYSGAMSGNGSLTKFGAGSLTLSGPNSYSGGSLVSAGALVGSTASLQGTITNSATVVMSQTTSGTFAGTMTGAGGFTKSGSGTVTLGDNTGYNGAVDLQAGGLIAADDNSLGSSAVTMTNGSIQAANGVIVANNFTIGSAPQTSYGSSTSLAAWDFSTIAAGTAGDPSNFGPSPYTGTYNSAVTSSGLVRPNGHTATNTGVAAAWGGNDWQAASAAQAVTDEDYVTFTIHSSGNLLKLDSVIAYNIRRSSTGATTGQWQYSTNGTTFTDIGSAITWGSATSSSGNAQSAIVLSNIAGLQDVALGTTVTFRILTFGGTAQAGTWYLKDLGNGATADFGVTGQLGTFVAGSGNGTLGISEAGSATFSGAISNNSVATLTAASGGTATFSGGISGLGSVTKTGEGTVTLSGVNTYSGGTTISAGVLSVGNGGTSGSITGAITNNTSLVFNRSDSSSYSGAISGSGTVAKSGVGSLTLSGASTYTNATMVSAGTLELNNTGGQALGSTASISVASGATLLISQSNQVNNSASVSLSGGTITRSSGVSQTFGALTVSGSSTLDFGSGTEGNLAFGTYTPSSLLTLNSFFGGNVLTFNSDLTGSIAVGTYNSTSYLSGDGLFQVNSISGGFTTAYNGSSFTITAIPEPSTYLAAAGLLSLMLWPSRKRLLKDAKKILGLTPPMRARLAARSKA